VRGSPDEVAGLGSLPASVGELARGNDDRVSLPAVQPVSAHARRRCRQKRKVPQLPGSDANSCAANSGRKATGCSSSRPADGRHGADRVLLQLLWTSRPDSANCCRQEREMSTLQRSRFDSTDQSAQASGDGGQTGDAATNSQETSPGGSNGHKARRNSSRPETGSSEVCFGGFRSNGAATVGSPHAARFTHTLVVGRRSLRRTCCGHQTDTSATSRQSNAPARAAGPGSNLCGTCSAHTTVATRGKFCCVRR
jgi:hypothetical protein